MTVRTSSVEHHILCMKWGHKDDCREAQPASALHLSCQLGDQALEGVTIEPSRGYLQACYGSVAYPVTEIPYALALPRCAALRSTLTSLS